MDITVRQAVPFNGTATTEIYTTSLGYECSKELVRTRLSQLDHDRETVCIAELDGRAVGFVHAELYKVLYFDTLVNILGIAVANDLKHNGIGRMLMSSVEQWARDKGAVGIRLNSGGTRTVAHDFYRALGFNDEKIQLRFNKSF